MSANAAEAVYYAIGDVHGRLDLLRALHAAIFQDWSSNHRASPAVLVHLGDYVDRGPQSRAVVERLIMMEAQAARRDNLDIVCLKGNHEDMMVQAVRDGDPGAVRHWAENGGDATLASYRAAGGDPDAPLVEAVDAEHVAWMEALPTIHVEPGRGLIFVHAGVDPRDWPDDREDVRLWTRSPRFFDDAAWPPALRAYQIVHGHTPSTDGRPNLGAAGLRIGVDTGAAFGGPLTAAVLAPGAEVRFLRAGFGQADDTREEAAPRAD